MNKFVVRKDGKIEFSDNFTALDYSNIEYAITNAKVDSSIRNFKERKAGDVSSVDVTEWVIEALKKNDSNGLDTVKEMVITQYPFMSLDAIKMVGLTKGLEDANEVISESYLNTIRVMDGLMSQPIIGLGTSKSAFNQLKELFGSLSGGLFNLVLADDIIEILMIKVVNSPKPAELDAETMNIIFKEDLVNFLSEFTIEKGQEWYGLCKYNSWYHWIEYFKQELIERGK